VTGGPAASYSPAEAESPTRVELLLVLVVVLVGFALRIALPARMAVEHFDEGVYASNYFFSGEKRDEQYPDQHLYAPPLVPLIIELAMVVFGTSNVVPMLVGVIAGGLTIPLVWWVGRRWFGPTAGLVAATLVALSDVHILFSRTALTDVPMCLFLIAAVHCFWVAQTSRSRLAVVLSGAFTGLAWWTKYNGWLPLAIGMAGVIPWKLIPLSMALPSGSASPLNARGTIWSLARALLIWGVVAVIALIVWGPWLWSLQTKGGYAAVAANHRGYLVGLAGWTAAFVAQARKLFLLSGSLTGCSALVAAVLALWRLRAADPRFTWNAMLRNDVIYLAFPVLALLCVIEGGVVILAFLGIVGAGIALARVIEAGGQAVDQTNGGLAAWLLTAWILGLVVSVPLYTPYPRLTLPLLLATWLGLGVLADAVVNEIQRAAGAPKPEAKIEPLLSSRRPGRQALARARPILLLALGVGIVVSVTQRAPWEQNIIGWQSRTGLAAQAPMIRDDLARDAGVDLQTGLDQFAVYTYGEPALLFQLRRSGCFYVKPVKDLGFAYPDAPAPRLPSYVAFGPQAWRTRGFGEQLAKALPRLKLVGKYRYAPSDVVVLDGPLIRHDRRPEYEIEVYLAK
jgi:hypothetical protein